MTETSSQEGKFHNTNKTSSAFDDMANLFGNGIDALRGVGDEMRGVMQASLERVVLDMDLVRREEVDVLKMQIQAQADAIASLKVQLGQPQKTTAKKGAKKPTVKKTAPEKKI